MRPRPTWCPPFLATGAPGIAEYRGQAAAFFWDEKTIVNELGTPDARDNKRQKKYLPLEIDLSAQPSD